MNTIIFSRMVIVPMRINDTKILRFKPGRSFAPYRSENITPLPIHKPKKTEVRNIINVYAEPTAANASAPRNCPTINVSAIL